METREGQSPFMDLKDFNYKKIKIQDARSTNEAREIEGEMIPGYIYVYNFKQIGKGEGQIRIWMREDTKGPEDAEMVVVTPDDIIKIPQTDKKGIYELIHKQVSWLELKPEEEK